MSYTVGDGCVALALSSGIVGYIYVKHLGSKKKLEIIHLERMAAMEKGIPLPEFPFEPAQERRPDPNVLPILGTVLSTLAFGTMIFLYLSLPAASHAIWLAPLPFVFLGVGLIAFHFLQGEPRR